MRITRFDDASRRVLLAARRATLAAGLPRVGSRQILLALLADTEVAAMLERLGIEGASVVAGLQPGALEAATALDPASLLDVVGVSRPIGGGSRSPAPILHRSVARPLRIMLATAGGGGGVVFDGSGRKVLEVALHNARGRLVGPTDLLRGVVADGADPGAVALTRAAGSGPARALFLELWPPLAG